MTRIKGPIALVLALALLVGTGCSKSDSASDEAAIKTAAGEGNAPVIACAEPNFDFGSVPQGEEVKHTFVIQNKGQGALKIESARGG